jgi:hypothetical protein
LESNKNSKGEEQMVIFIVIWLIAGLASWMFGMVYGFAKHNLKMTSEDREMLLTVTLGGLISVYLAIRE